MKASSLYVHIPFCPHICGYCDFPKVIYHQEWAESYLPALFAEIKGYEIQPHSQDTIYIGGGTPTSLPLNLLEELLSFLSPLLKEGGEFTIEANPETIDEEKAKLLSSYGINRVSIGFQTKSKRLLKLMGRHHGEEDVRAAVEVFKKAGIANLNCDLIYGLPLETKEELEEDLAFLLSLDLPHISAYSLILEKATAFSSKGIKEASQEEQAEQYELVLAKLREHGYARYEVSNFAKEGYQSRHNKTYWKDLPYYGVGLGAAGYLEGVRYKNTLNLSSYIKGKTVEESEPVSIQDDEEYFLLTNLRLEEGFALEDYNQRFGVSFLAKHQEAIAKLVAQNLLEISSERVKPTDKGLLLLDTILVNLF